MTVLGLSLLVSIGAPFAPPHSRSSQKDTAAERLSLGEIVKRLPRRVSAKDGTPGDMVNFLIVGSRESMEGSLRAAGWVKVDRTNEDAVLNAVLQTLEKKPYLEMPMSKLYLFDRAQDYGFAKALPIEVVASRHHFRIWHAPWLSSDGQVIWIGTGTHDIGIERDRRNRRLTHKIDPDVDKEREFIADSLNETGKVRELRYETPSDPVRTAATATGGSFHSDGRVLVIRLK